MSNALPFQRCIHTFITLLLYWNYIAHAYSTPDSQNALCDLFSKTVPAERNAMCMKHYLLHEESPTPCPLFIPLWIMNTEIKTKVLINFETSEMMCVELKAKKLKKLY